MADVGGTEHVVLKDPPLHVVLYQPEIPANTGNIARLCGAAQMRLHLIHPLGFSVDDKHLKRAGLDYWPEIDVQHHRDFDAFLKSMTESARLLCFSRHAVRASVLSRPIYQTHPRANKQKSLSAAAKNRRRCQGSGT